MRQPAERYYEFLTPGEALDPAPIDYLNLADEHRRMLREAHRRIAPDLIVLTVEHLSYESANDPANKLRLKAGQLVVHEELADTVLARFAFLQEQGFAIQKIKPHVMYGYNDALAMADNNTSCYRPDFLNPERGSLSKHFAGAAVDIEPIHNKQRNRDGTVAPPHIEGYTGRDESVLMYNLPIRLDWSDAGFEYGGTWPVAGIELITGHADHYPGAPADEHHFELRDEKLPTETGLMDMRDLTLPKGIVYEHPGRILVAF